MDKVTKLEDEIQKSQKERQATEKILNHELNENRQMVNELKSALVESNSKLSKILFENENLNKSHSDKDEVLAKLSVKVDFLQHSLNLLKDQIKAVPNEFQFEGKLVNGLKQGKGIYTCPDFSYEGEFKNDIICGKG